MGKLLYGPGGSGLAVDDRDLAHLRVVIIAKFRRGESFGFTWERTADEGSGRHSVWMTPTMFVEFVFYGSRAISLNRKWIDTLMKHANSVSGLELAPETQTSPLVE